MDQTEQVYRKLQQHLDNQAVGYPATKSGAEIRLLKRFFSPEEARLAMYLTYKPDSIEHIKELAKDSGIALGGAEDLLNNMARNGVIGLVEKEGTRCFYTIPFIVGMFEGQLKRLTPEFLSDFGQYTNDKSFGLAFLSTELPQMRTIPVGKSISVEHQVATYDHIVDIINGADGPFAILECICRKMAGLKGDPCRKTSRQETCLAIGDMAKNVIQYANGRAIGREEALEIARMNEADGLVFQPSNTRKVDFICSCCGCCCGMLRLQKILPKPVDFWATNYCASVNAGTCSGCGICVERCQVNAVTVDDRAGTAVINLDRCIGCGNCVSTCPTGAMSLLKKEKEIVPPQDSEDLYDVIMANKKGRLGKIKLAAKLRPKK
ncbi:MAG: 4Fe-4S binding protein [Candidatus Edwardsbacteria bacterium]|nr:4Fe-4S binding protein [Candidatus Edwardsbacteria bacterium]MBU1575859.1 4Fe-4S binding protein [Candidatus Edwardsbacteria bacterium]MBU2463645.1 4Fe-4S binding protein [Candidatus Edwardsbacteria bacterium]MBU2593073.1 4Fe-4S binding protein [Candidatus Edwardsbacteria bacterium]